jgi:HEAT repeat protein
MLGPPPLPRNLEASLRDLDSAKPLNRAGAIADLVRHARGDDAVRARAIPLIAKRMKDDDAKVRAAAAVALGDLAAKDRVDLLLAAVEDDDGNVRQMALNALGELGDDRALPRLRKALRDRRPEVRYQAIIAFARTAEDAGDVDAALLAATNDEDDAIAHIALRIAEERVDEGKPADPRILSRARVLVKSGAPSVALVAAILLAKSGEDAGHALVLEVVRTGRLRGEAPDKEDESAAVELAGELGLREAIPELARRAFSLSRFVRNTCSYSAKIALARLGDPRAKGEILKDLDASKPRTRAAAVAAAGRARVVEARAKIAAMTAASVDPDVVKEALRRLDEAAGGPAAAGERSDDPASADPGEPSGDEG